jgi:hypothetical protein
MSRIPISSLANGVLFATQRFSSPANPAGVPILTPGIGEACEVYLHNTTTPASVWVAETGSTLMGQPLLTDASGTVPGWIDSAALPLDLVVGTQTFVLAGGSGGVPSTSGTTGSGLGATQTIDFGSQASEKWLVGTLNANLTLTVANYVPGCKAFLSLAQDGTGGRTLNITDGGSPQAIPIPATANSTGVVLLTATDSGNVYATSLSVPGPAGFSGTSAQWFIYAGGGTPTGLVGMNPGDKCLRADGEVFNWNGVLWVDAAISLKGSPGSSGASGSGITVARTLTLPASPTDNQVCSLVVDDTNGIEWMLRWDATKGVWRCIGGNPLGVYVATVNGGSSFSVTTSYATMTGGASLTLPTVGTSMDVVFDFGAQTFGSTVGSGPSIGLSISGAAPAAGDPVAGNYDGATISSGTATPATRTPIKTAVAPGAVVVQEIKANLTGTFIVSQAWIAARCVQIHP